MMNDPIDKTDSVSLSRVIGVVRLFLQKMLLLTKRLKQAGHTDSILVAALVPSFTLVVHRLGVCVLVRLTAITSSL